MALLLLLAMGLSAGPADCRFAVPADLPVGWAEWIGACAGGKADGLGVVRVGTAGGGAQMFYGVVKAGMPVEGMMGDSGSSGWRVVPGFDGRMHVDETLPAEMQQSPKYWKEAAAAARVAARHYAGVGNGASAKFYEGQAKVLDRGPGE